MSNPYEDWREQTGRSEERLKDFVLPTRCSVLTVETAAVKNKEGKVWTLPRPLRHDDVEDKAIDEGQTGYMLTKGFVLSDGNFADREQAEVVARASGQKKGKLIHPHLDGLSSDDLW